MLQTPPRSVDEVIAAACDAVRQGDGTYPAIFDDIDLPLYVTDPEGKVTYFNRASVGFAGRVPDVGKDQWCVTWKLYTQDGEFLPHEECPMAIAVREQRPIRGLEAVAERPDGTRRSFIPYPTPLFDADGGFAGAVNVLLDVTARKASALRREAKRFRRMAASITDDRTIGILNGMAVDFDDKADALDRPN